jgi:hypothetical protein
MRERCFCPGRGLLRWLGAEMPERCKETAALPNKLSSAGPII